MKREELNSLNHRAFGLAVARYLREAHEYDVFSALGIPCKEYSQTGRIDDTRTVSAHAICWAGQHRPIPSAYVQAIADRFPEIDLQRAMEESHRAPDVDHAAPGLPEGTGDDVGATQGTGAIAAPSTVGGGEQAREERLRALMAALGDEINRPPAAPAAKPLDPAEIESLVGPLINSAIDELAQNTQLGLDKLGEVIAEIRDFAKSGATQARRVRRAINKATGSHASKLEELFAEYCEPGASVYPVQITGGSGIGKTYAALRHAKNFERCVMIGGSEAVDFTGAIGWNVPGVGSNGQASLVYRDGDISSAFRSVRLDESGNAAPGTLANCILIIDELNRLELKIQGTLIPALGILKHPITDEECYRLVTEKHSPSAPASYNNGVTETEILWAPVAKLAIIATSNEGGDFQTQNVDEAGQARFVKHRVYYIRNEAEAIYSGELQAYGYNDHDKRGKQLCDLVEKVATMRQVQGVFEASLSTRIVCREIKAASGWDDLCRKLHADVVNHCCKLDASDYIDSLSAKAADAAIKGALGWAPTDTTGKYGVSV